MKTLVTGAKGMLGVDLCQTLQQEKHTILPTDIEEMDVRNEAKVFSVINDFKPDIVIHLAAMTDVDGCEKAPDATFLTNTIGTQNVALACQKLNIAMVYLCTGSVYDGTKHEPYIEYDTPNPLSIYAKSKYQGELAVLNLLHRYYIFYAGWMFGGAERDKKFVAKIINLAREKKELKVVDDKFGSPTYTIDISHAIAKFIETGRFGRYHLANVGYSNRYGVSQKILEYAGIKTCRLMPVSSAEFPLPAPRPRMEALRNYQLELMGMNLMRPWQEALKEYVEKLTKER